MTRFLQYFALVTLINILGSWAAATYSLNMQVPLSYWVALAFIATLTLAIHRALLHANNKRPQVFVTYFMGALTIKLFFSVLLLIVVGLLVPDQLTFTAIAYICAYMTYTAIEIIDLLPKMKQSG
jgi:hypothetical protein